MSCCDKERIANLTAKCSDNFGVEISNNSYEGYVPKDLGIGGGSYLEFAFCLNCGKIKGTWPAPISSIENV